MRETHSYWYCFHCQAEISPSCVTNDEHHDLCGHEVYCIDSDISVDRLEELIAAEREGQCVILPCKVGTPTYVIAKDCKNNPDHSKYCFCFGKSCTTCEDSYDRVWETTSKTTDIRTIVENMGLCGENGGFGKTVFLTKEQAESKLAEMKGGE